MGEGLGKNAVRDISMASEGRRKINWVKKNMPVLNIIEKRFREERPFIGLKMALSIHLEAKTAYLAEVFAAGGADISVTGSNSLSTKDDVAAALAVAGLSVYAWHNSTEVEYRKHLDSALAIGPNIVIDDGGDLVNILHTERRDLLRDVYGACEETTAGVLRAKARERKSVLEFPMIAVNDAACKYIFDNRYGTGQSVWDGIMRTTNLVISGKNVVIIGYGWCGRGCAVRASGLGANVTVCEIDPVKALEAAMDGFRVEPMEAAASQGDIFVTATGCRRVIYNKHYKDMKNGVILANAGHFNKEIALNELDEYASEKHEVRENITGYRVPGDRWINVLGKGSLVNIACADGHPAEIMDLSFSLQALSGKYIAEHHAGMDKKIIPVPEEINGEIAGLKLSAMGISIDSLSEDQKAYLSGWEV